MDGKLGTPDQQLQWFKNRVAQLEAEAEDLKKQHKEEMVELIDEMEELRYALSVAKGDKKDTAERLLRKEYQFYELRQVLYNVGVRLTARETQQRAGPVKDQLAEANRFISSIGGQLEDGVRGVIQAAQERMRRDSD